jgi:hypothetical protein
MRKTFAIASKGKIRDRWPVKRKGVIATLGLECDCFNIA